MTNPSNIPPSRFVAGAVDLGAVKQQAEQRAQAQAAQAKAAQAGAAGGAAGGSATGGTVAFVSTITPENFEFDLVVRSTQVPVITLLGSARSDASEQMRADFTTLAESQQAPTKWLFRYVDVDATPEVAQAFGVQAIPTVIALAAGRPLTNFEGGQPAAQLHGWVDAVVEAVDGKLRGLAPEEDPANGAGAPNAGEGAGADGVDPDDGDPRLAAAAEKLEQEDYAGAVAEYDAILAAAQQSAERVDEEVVAEARAARANALLMQRLSTGGDKFAESDRLLLAGDKPQAFDLLIEELRPSAEGSAEHKKQAKARLLELFALFDPADPEVIAGRTRMASALF
ncbi:tetratricopeptide repeat protein [uncultured Corynebacterium sp.]|uniref:tetratricopeptide repeat protein n=1 Tax=uncultured Corynebacterium sp. TaxID=159447 RepID=UPI0025E99FDB|nr:tetratricopeptide repeat protein [uncultured Corynebacterium sp.]